jgi:hypothetical protein
LQRGWLFDVYFSNGNIYVWVMGEDKTFYRHVEKYNPYFLIDAEDKNYEVLYDISEITGARYVERLFPIDEPERRTMIMVEPEWKYYKNVLKVASHDPRILAIYDSDLLPVQKFLFNKFKIEPGSAVNFLIDDEKMHVLHMKDRYDEYPPPFDLTNDIICGRSCWKRESSDPVDYVQGSCAGRILMDERASWFKCNEMGLAALIERARFAFLPLGLAARWSSNRIIDSRNAFTLISRGFAVPVFHAEEPSMAMTDFLERDRGGYTIPPKSAGVFENVGVIDFDSEYPSIIVREGISYGGHGWLLPEVIKPWLERRLEIKRSIKLINDQRLRAICKARSDSLKLLLVSEYGISGCSRNRFGNHFAFEEINRISRDVMLKAKHIAENLGYEVIYGDVDSLFIKKDGAKREEYETVSNIISQETGLPVSLDKLFRVIAFITKKGDARTAAVKRYFGITEDGQIESRGIEARRNDVPEAIRTFQQNLIEKIYASGNLEEIKMIARSVSSKMLSSFIAELREGNIPSSSLMFEKIISKDPDEYETNVPQKIAAILSGARKGDAVRYTILTNGVSVKCGQWYDWRKYAELAISAARTVLEPLGIIPTSELKLECFLT